MCVTPVAHFFIINGATKNFRSIKLMSKNSSLRKADKAKNDEFYTQLADIEKELKHYKTDFFGKTVFCNCDDPFESNFFKYFAMNLIF